MNTDRPIIFLTVILISLIGLLVVLIIPVDTTHIGGLVVRNVYEPSKSGTVSGVAIDPSTGNPSVVVVTTHKSEKKILVIETDEGVYVDAPVDDVTLYTTSVGDYIILSCNANTFGGLLLCVKESER